MKMKQGKSDCYLTSSNAINENGDIINLNGLSNKIAGINKITKDINSAHRQSSKGRVVVVLVKKISDINIYTKE